MVTLTNNGWSRSGNDTQGRVAMPPDPSCQPCPACGGLECLCRPRFFAGQLLTEQDLNRLDHYITEKHKLHNRYLWGSGVVAGLEVRCAPCDDMVTVSEGYALSPCGEDIVVCKDDSVDICALIARCRVDTDPDCRPYQGQDDCGDVIEDWILAIRYAETPSRGITPLTGSGCGCSCSGNCSGKGGCGGSCGGGHGCSCGTAQAVAAAPVLTTPRMNRGAPPSCEPTLTCESYRYDVYRAPVVDAPKDDRQRGLSGIAAQLEGEMFARIECCLKELEAALPAAPGDIAAMTEADRQLWFNWCCRVRTALANYLVRIGGTDCEAIARLQAVICPVPSQPLDSFKAAMLDALVAYFLIAIELIFGCFCSAALPPVRAPGDPRVPLAVVKVRRRDCHIVSVCNWTPVRKHVLTFPTLEYWFGWVPVIRIVREFMHRICCDLLGLRGIFQPRQGVAGAQNAPGMVAARDAGQGPQLDDHIPVSPLNDLNGRTGLFQAVIARGLQSGDGTKVSDMLAAVFSRPDVTIGENLSQKDQAADIARVAQTAPLAMLGGMAAPLVEQLARLSGRGSAGSGAAPSAEIVEMRAAIARQSEEIAVLRRQMAETSRTKNRKPG